ncbi:putative bifunctional diguanylate cyclase/phosphodiesterase [Nakamurella deserti]|uniref:putative bifunctional diguanylate cyclase/phosphodiesterase n=1 Tax=Nakamurella deserti TaxID=2164074 RepID=UPI00130024C8|nr:EAL domain-containing protein [Nakamurella deserti]
MLSDMVWALGDLAARAAQGATPDELLTGLCSAAVAALEVDGAAVMAVRDGRCRFVWARPAEFTGFSRLQEALQQGPCRDAMSTGTVIRADTAAELQMRWPELSSAAAPGSPDISSVLVVPLMSRGRCWGTLDLFWVADGELPPGMETAARALAEVAVSYLVLAVDSAAAGELHDRMTHKLLHDQLTGLPNRGLIHEMVFHALSAVHRRGSAVAVLFVDLDGFKAINDVHGHVAGDTVLREVALRLRACVRDSDSVARLSGDEFLVLCEDLPAAGTDVTAATTVLADRIRAAVARPIVVEGVSVTVTASIGVAITTDRPSVAELIHDADMAMYEAKALGPGGTVTHSDPRHLDGHRRHSLERRLFDALRREELTVLYQPIVAPDATVVAVEALLRWQRPGDTLVAAADFIDLAQSTGVIVPIGHWVIRRALTDLRHWRDTAPGTAPDTVWCNLSPRELVAPDLPGVIRDALADVGLHPRHLGVEILEQHLTDVRAVAALAALRAAGHPLAIDDFGTGYSSLSRLVDLPVTHLKIDRSLVAGLPDHERSRTLTRAVLTIADELGVTVVSEGIETQAQAAYLTAAGTHLLQGFLYSRPSSADTITRRLAAPGGTSPAA